MKLTIRPLCLVAALTAFFSIIQTVSAQTTVNIAASDNAYGFRSQGDTVQGVTQTLTTKRLNDNNSRIAYARFNVSAYTSQPNNVQTATLRLYLANNTLADTVKVYGLTNLNLNSVSDSAWTSSTLTWNNQPAKTAAPNDISSSATALPNANTTAVLASQAITTTPGEVDFTLSITDFRNLLANDNNGQITLLWYNTGNNGPTWASLANTGGNLVPTLQLVVVGGGPISIPDTNIWTGANSGDWDTTTQNWLNLLSAPTNFVQTNFVIFKDGPTVTNINLTTALTIGGMLATNVTTPYVFTGAGNLVGPGGLTKSNAGSFTIANSIANTFSGGIDIEGGVVQVGNGNNDVGAGNLGIGNLTNNSVLLFDMGASGSVTVPNAIYGSGTISNIGPGAVTLSGNSSFTSGLQVQAGSVRASATRGLGAGTAFVNTNATLILSASVTNFITLANATLATADGNQTLATNSELMMTPGTTNILRSGDPLQNTGTSRDFGVDARLRGGGLVLVQNADGTVSSPDGNQGVRFRNTNTVSDFTGTIIATNNSKVELLVSGPGPFSPINTGTLQLYCGGYSGGNSVTATVPGGYLEFNVRNNSTGNSLINNNVQLLGTGTPGANAVVINAIGSAPNGTASTLGNLSIGDTQELIGYRGAGATTQAVQFASVTLNGGTATFSPHSSSFGVANQAGTDFILNNITEGVAGSSLVMNGLGNLTLAGTSTYTGFTSVQQGKMWINGFNNGNSLLTNASGSTLGGNGTNSGAVEVDGTLAPGASGAAGTFGSGNLTLNGALAFDVGTNNTIGGGVNDLVKVAGNLTLNNGTATVVVNPLVPSATQPGTYRLIDYTGTLTGTFSANPAQVARFQFALDYGTAHQVNLNVTGGPVPVVWDSTSSSVWDFGPSGTGNWSNTVSFAPTDMFFQGDTVSLKDIPGVQTNLVISGITVLPTSMTMNSSTNYTITGTGNIGGSGGVTKLGSGTLTLGTTNTFTGNTVVSGGTLLINNTNALGSWASTATITNGGTFDIGGLGAAVAQGNPLFGPKQFFIGGAGVGGNGVLVNSSANNQQGAYENVTLVAPATIGGGGRWDMRNGTPGPVLDLAGFKLTKTGTNQISLVSVYVTAGDIDINQGILSFETTSTITNGGTVTVNPNGYLGSFRLNAGGFTRQIVLNGGTITNLAGGGATNDAPISVNADSMLSCQSGNDLYLRGPISGSFGLIKITNGTVIFSGTNTYSGNTSISNGVIALVDGASSLTNSPNIIIASGATLDLTRRTNSTPANTLTLVSGQTLNDNGLVLAQVVADNGAIVSGSGTLASNLTINSGALLSPGGSNALGRLTVNLSPSISAGGRVLIEIDKGNAATNDQLFASGPIIYNGTLTVTNIGATPLAAGDTFKIFSGSLYPTPFATLNLASPGGTLYWYTNNLNVDGTLSISNSVAPGPTTNATITKVTLSSTNLLIHGTNNNVPNNTFHYVVLSTPNLTNTFSNWTPVVTNPFNPDGTFDYTNPIVPGTPRQFIDIQVVP
jgi:fibronectin-binding autotransporter adhesin